MEYFVLEKQSAFGRGSFPLQQSSSIYFLLMFVMCVIVVVPVQTAASVSRDFLHRCYSLYFA